MNEFPTDKWNCRVLVVSDGSTDRTEDIVKNIRDPRVSLLSYCQNQGKGQALRFGIERTTAKVVACIDADLDIHPNSLIRLLEILEITRADAVVGSKFHRLSNVEYPKLRRVQSQVFKKVVQIVFGLRISDTQTGVKVFNGDLVRKATSITKTRGFSFDLELLTILNDLDANLVEGPVSLDYQYSSTVTLRSTLTVVSDIFRIWAFRRQRFASASAKQVDD
jgi:glycosyltransferase involved in cell wall biosynthesis